MSNEPVSPIIRPTWFKKSSREDVTEKELKKATEEIENDPTLVKNGWTPTKLAAYFKEREVANTDRILRTKPARPTRTNGWHNPHRWRR